MACSCTKSGSTHLSAAAMMPAVICLSPGVNHHPPIGGRRSWESRDYRPAPYGPWKATGPVHSHSHFPPWIEPHTKKIMWCPVAIHLGFFLLSVASPLPPLLVSNRNNEVRHPVIRTVSLLDGTLQAAFVLFLSLVTPAQTTHGRQLLSRNAWQRGASNEFL